VNTTTVRQLHNATSATIEHVRSTGGSVLVTRHGSPVAVILPVDPDELEDYILANAPEFVRSMKTAEREVARGETVPLEQVIAEHEGHHGPLDG
jgi:prevent-host-death family protein